MQKPSVNRTRQQPRTPRRAVLAGSPTPTAQPVAAPDAEPAEAPKKRARKRAPKSETTDE